MGSHDKLDDEKVSGKGVRKNESKGVVQPMAVLTEDLQDKIKNEGKAEEECRTLMRPPSQTRS